MASSSSEMVKDTKVTSATTNDGAADVAIGAVEEHRPYTFPTFYRSVLFQMILFGLLSLVGPAMSDAISNLGGGGLSTPWLANLANSLSYAMSFCSTILGGPIINKIGIKWSCMIAAVAMPLKGSAYYVSARTDNQWYLLLANVINGIASGFLYVGETTAMLSYPKPEDRGMYLGIWSAMRSSGSVIGGAINFSTNYSRAGGGGVAWATYLIFVGFECSGFIWALLLSPTAKVRRRDNSPVSMSVEVSWKQEFIALWRYLKDGKTWLVFVPSFYSFFYGGTMGTYLSLHFSVRARALSSLLVPVLTIPSVIVFGKLLDGKGWSQPRRAWIATMSWLLPQMACFIWVAYEYHVLPSKIALDPELHSSRWAKAYIPYLVIFVTGYWTQLTLYWILSTFSDKVDVASRAGGVFRAFETAGQAVSYGLSSASQINHVIPLYVNCAVLVLTIPSMVLLINKVPKVRADVVYIDQDPMPSEDVAKKD
ncbi:major facilitator superfamily domain-containing protein [Paraphoma chrysanthemicola]|uniref:Major facilitator superfamily domain-containing protein n=1 Tax=Paraphoma chrysanthemicola TaxID=798071 RepID=A0A8K0RHZ8_9PLEO|nr:major facilitator superfamily domain-containing protein [Paraphoma chrysanthemicola]